MRFPRLVRNHSRKSQLCSNSNQEINIDHVHSIKGLERVEMASLGDRVLMLSEVLSDGECLCCLSVTLFLRK